MRYTYFECLNCHKSCTRKFYSNPQRNKFCSKKCAATGTFNSSYRHGGSSKENQKPEYKIWAGMNRRCRLNSRDQNAKFYAGRGIMVCEDWKKFETFFRDMGPRPSNKHSLDRIDNDKGYCPQNCRWATHQEQMNNTRQNHFLTLNKKKMTIEQWGRETGLGGLTIFKRLKRGWTVENSITKPKMKNWSISEYNKISPN